MENKKFTVKLMPQLDIITYNYINVSLFIVFWAYFAMLYVAVSYSMHKVSAGVYFKFTSVVSALVTVLSLKCLDALTESADLENSVVCVKNEYTK